MGLKQLVVKMEDHECASPPAGGSWAGCCELWCLGQGGQPLRECLHSGGWWCSLCSQGASDTLGLSFVRMLLGHSEPPSSIANPRFMDTIGKAKPNTTEAFRPELCLHFHCPGARMGAQVAWVTPGGFQEGNKEGQGAKQEDMELMSLVFSLATGCPPGQMFDFAPIRKCRRTEGKEARYSWEEGHLLTSSSTTVSWELQQLQGHSRFFTWGLGMLGNELWAWCIPSTFSATESHAQPL